MSLFTILKTIIISVILTQNVYANDNFHEKYIITLQKNDEIARENEIINQKNRSLEEKIIDLNSNVESLENEKNVLLDNNKQLENIKIIEINKTILIIFFITIILSVIVILFLALIISRQRKWRKEFYDENNNKFIGLLPERIAETIDKVEEEYKKLYESNYKQYDDFNKNLQQVVNLIGEVSKNNSDSVSKINEQLSSLRKFSDEKNELVKKYQKFYDLSVLKNFIFDIIASIDNLENNIKKLENENKSQDSINAIKSAKDRLVILLENENIEVVEPNTDLKFNDPKQTVQCKVIETLKTSDESLVGMISSVIHSGYNGIIGPNNEITLLREAWVNIYSKDTEEEEENG